MPGALDGIRVIDFGQYIAGPMAAMLLADQGADVVRIDPPGGPRYDGPANATWNRGKRSILLDLKSAEGRARAERLIQSADVVVENFRPGVMERLGLGPAATLAANPRLIFCSLPGFASDDRRAGTAAWEGVVAAATATYRPNSQTGKPVYTAIPISSAYAAFLGAVSIAMALNVRDRDGAGQAIEVPLFDATFAAIGFHGLRIHNQPPPEDAARTRMMAWTRQFRCRDGRWFMYHAGNQNARPFFEATGAATWLDSDWDALTPQGQNRRIEDLFLSRTAAEWEALCEQVGTEGAVCRTSAEWLEDPHALESRIVIESDDPVLGKVRGPGINVRMSETPGSIRGPRPVAGADEAAILAALPPRYPTPAEAAVPALRAALDGVKVLDLCIILAGPTSARTLAEFGADVIKIDSPHRAAVAFHNDINRAKRSIVLDLKSEAGMAVFWRLLADADVVVQNFRKGVADRLGIGYEAVRARKPYIVYGSMNTYGQVGRYATRPGHEQIAQAATGMQERYGGDGRPTLAPFAVNDYGTGFMGAYAVALALLHRNRTGQGQHVDTALAYTATMLQSSLLQDFAGKVWDEPRGQHALGSSPFHRLYEAADGWLFLAGTREQFLTAPAIAGLSGMEDAAFETALEERLRTRDIADWVAELTPAGIGAHAAIPTIAALMEDPWVRAHGLSITREHEGFGPITTNGPSPRLSRTPPEPGRPAPPPGSDAASILTEIGLLADMDRLIADGVVKVAGIAAR